MQAVNTNRVASRLSSSRSVPTCVRSRRQRLVVQASLPTPNSWWRQACGAGVTAASVFLLCVSPAPATDTLAVGSCVLAKCQAALAQCVADVGCFEDLVCLNTCNNRPDEIDCQIKCGDLYEDKSVGVFNACAVSDQKCVPTKADEGLYPKPPDCALDTAFQLDNFTGTWFITAGLNPLFDIFDCQEHRFVVPEPGRLVGDINWRVNKGNGDFISRHTEQRFVQNPTNPALLSNRGNEYLHYEDDWYIIASKPDNYVFIYYQGNNDAWKGYGGAVVYTKDRALPEEYIPELKAAAEKVGLTWDKFVVTDNTCPPKPLPKRNWLLQEVDQDFKILEKELEDSLQSFGKGFTVIEQELEQELLQLTNPKRK